MNKSNSQNSATKKPLDNILGSKGHIMVLRQLSETENPMSHSELLDRTNLSRQGVYDVVKRLAAYGIVEYVGSGNNKQIVLRTQYPLTGIILQLFKAEEERFNYLVLDLKEEINNSPLKPHSAWIFGKVAQGTDDYGDPIHLAILSNVGTVDKITDDFRDQLYDAAISKKYDITLDVIGVTEADLESSSEMVAEPIILLWGMDPHHMIDESMDGSGKHKTHEDFDNRSLADAKAWSKLLKTYPEIINRTIQYLNTKAHESEPGEYAELLEWRKILESMSQQRLKKFLESDAERAARLRQSLPFWQVLNEHERAKLEELKSHE